MAVIDFPTSPTVGQQFTSGGITWTWDGVKWTAATGGGGMTDAPNDGTAYARKSQAWAHLTHNDITDWAASVPAAYVLPTASTTVLGGVKVDGSTIAINSGVISAGGASITVSDTAPSSPSAGALWFNSSAGSGGGQLYIWYTDPNTSQWVPTTNQMGGGYLPLQGVTNGSDAPPGQIGEVISSNVTTGVTLTNNATANVTSIVLTAGDWDVSGEVWVGVGTGGATLLSAGINFTNGVLPAASSPGSSRGYLQAALPASSTQILVLRPCRVSLSGSATYYLMVYALFPSGTTTGTGNIWARRAR